jgi:hypothetical protein
MAAKLWKGEEWVWVLAEEPQAGQVSIFGQYDQEKEIQFIPVFSSREEAQRCVSLMQDPVGKPYEAQAMRLQEVTRNAADKGFKLFLVDGRGAILEEIDPG